MIAPLAPAPTTVSLKAKLATLPDSPASTYMMTNLYIRVAQGVGIRNDLLAAQVAEADARQKNLQANAILDVAKSAYNRALQRPLDTDVTLEDLSEPTESFDLESMTQRALAGRPEIAELNASVRGLRSRAGVVRAGYRPQFAVQGGFEYIENRFFQHEAFAKVAVISE